MQGALEGISRFGLTFDLMVLAIITAIPVGIGSYHNAKLVLNVICNEIYMFQTQAQANCFCSTLVKNIYVIRGP